MMRKIRMILLVISLLMLTLFHIILHPTQSAGALQKGRTLKKSLTVS